MKEIELTQGYTAIVDDEEYERVSPYNWYVKGNKNVATNIRGKQVFMSHLVLNIDGHQRVAYLNGDTLDLRKSNLKIVSRQELAFKKRKSNGTSSQYKGVCWKKETARWSAKITYNGKTRHLGYFDDETDAARAYDESAQELFGELACLNFPDNPLTQLEHSTRPVYSGQRKSKIRTCTSQYKGVSYCQRNGWVGAFFINGQTLRRRTDTEMEAVKFYDEMILKHLGSNARSNFESIWAWKRREKLERKEA